ncbi:MAG: uridine kinase [Flavobacteriales bacterium]|nr:uridine kinase [Flavobacteriales bacterium]
MIDFIIGITGGSGVGKTTLIDHLRSEFGSDVSVFSLDNYYLPKETQKLDENGVVNFDLPTALDVEAIEKDVNTLMKGKTVQLSRYNFNNPSTEEEILTVHPSRLLIVEGLFVMHYAFLREKLNLSVYLSVEEELQLQRRLKRDVEERNYTYEDVMYQWKNHVLPAYDNYVRPYKKEVDLIITNNTAFDENIDTLISVIRKKLNKQASNLPG